jgi:hypothetical protein
MKRSEWTYLAQLARAMQAECVDGRIAGDFIAEIDAHLAETDVDPADEFGPPAALAREVAGRTGARRRWDIRSPWLTMTVGLLVFLVVILVYQAIMSGWPDETVISVGDAIYGLMFFVLSVGFGYVATRRLDGRSWAPLKGWKALLTVVVIAAIGTTLSTVLGERVLITVPRSGVIGAIVVGAPLVAILLLVGHNPIRFPDHAQHLRPLRRGLWADRYGTRPQQRPREHAGM